MNTIIHKKAISLFLIITSIIACENKQPPVSSKLLSEFSGEDYCKWNMSNKDIEKQIFAIEKSDSKKKFITKEKTLQLLNQGKFQELAWIHNSLNHKSEANHIIDELNHIVSSIEPKSLPHSLGGRSKKKLLQFNYEKNHPENSVLFVFKEENNSLSWHDMGAEIAAYQVDLHFNLNIVPFTVPYIFKNKAGTLQYFVQESTIPRNNEIVKTYGLHKMRFLDYLNKNFDRSIEFGNVIKSKLNFSRLVAIDNGGAFLNDARGDTDFCIPLDNLAKLIQNDPDLIHIILSQDKAKEQQLISILIPLINRLNTEKVISRLHKLKQYLSLNNHLVGNPVNNE